jgi:TATA-box binding protein (TBP) (component of TFIID and TFIIIB)
MDLSSIWESYLNNDEPLIDVETPIQVPTNMPKCGKLNISTKTKILYFNFTLSLEELFWKLPIISYDTMQEGIIKKQMKFIFSDKQQVDEFETQTQNITLPLNIKILNHIDNPNGRIQFKDTRKVSIGLSKNDVLKQNKKSKEKSVFYNCFVLIYRVSIDNIFRELHIKLFNSGKVEIPGIQDNFLVDIASKIIANILCPYISHPITEHVELRENILVNSNFNSNFHINRDVFVRIIKSEGVLKCIFDSCSYPGIQCKYKLNNGQQISVMIFRTGSILIVGKCEDDDLFTIYNYVTDLLERSYEQIYDSEYIPKQKKNKKKIKKLVYVA